MIVDSDTGENQGLAASQLDLYAARLTERGTKSLLVLRNERLVLEQYAGGFSQTTPHYTASLAKTLVGGLALAVAVSEGYMAYDDLACTYIKAWQEDPLKSRITVRQLAAHTSGLDNAAQGTEAGWERMFWQKDPGPDALDPITCALYKAPQIHEPGTSFLYSNPGFAALAYAITASLQPTPYPNIRELLREKLMLPLGIADAEWSIGYGKPFPLDGMEVYATWGGGEFTARAVLQLGRLLLHTGRWEGRELIRPQVLRPMMAGNYKSVLRDEFPEGFLPTSSVGGFVNHYNVFPSVPDCTFIGAGAGHQLMIVIPSLDMVIVRMGDSLLQGAKRADEDFWNAIKELLLDPIPAMLLHQSPFPQSDRVRSVSFEPAASIRITGEDSDNWPCTWGEDGTLFTSYGDGYGFVPHTEKKLSLGLAVLHGTPQSFEGVNLRTETGEREGDGPHGLKASGLLAVDGTLYMLARNAGNSQLAWSEDNGRTWEWGFTFETSFGCPTFVNYGQHYEGAQDNYVYIYSPDGPSAYEEYDHIVLARVNRDHIRSRSAYEFYRGTDEAGAPIWTTKLEDRGPVFTFPRHCHRLEALYHAATGRYWLVPACNHEGSWGIFDAPTPWGPWSTVYYTEYWGLGRTHSYRFPTKWISTDGTQLQLIFSGRRFKATDYDACCVRTMTLQLAGDDIRP
ncbi:serine hydrolase [Paenibacillus oryzisoli]|uniref:serine hydrolase n=1 Tax=Paenibacillus oryzisoli TaxID=1850517 RepID=UPI003D2AF82A